MDWEDTRRCGNKAARFLHAVFIYRNFIRFIASLGVCGWRQLKSVLDAVQRHTQHRAKLNLCSPQISRAIFLKYNDRLLHASTLVRGVLQRAFSLRCNKEGKIIYFSGLISGPSFSGCWSPVKNLRSRQEEATTKM